jgi:hypothetical protein
VEGLSEIVVVLMKAAAEVDNYVELWIAVGKEHIVVVVQTVEVEARIGYIGMMTVVEKGKTDSDGKEMMVKIALGK